MENKIPVYRVSSVKLPLIQTLFHNCLGSYSSQNLVFPGWKDASGAWHNFLCDSTGGIVGAVPESADGAIYYAPTPINEQACRECHQVLKDYSLDATLQLADLDKIFNHKGD